ncbi:MAG: hypothetical protein HOQ05_08905 [Corynebacteriales bacterium]|nr:hypothetical protein [Mycobacteriales bacterium]
MSVKLAPTPARAATTPLRQRTLYWAIREVFFGMLAIGALTTVLALMFLFTSNHGA